MMRPIALLAVLGTLVGCTTPGLNYNTTLMASSPAAAATRNVSVSHFAGPAGGWYARQFEAMLANTTLDGQAWFALADAYSLATRALCAAVDAHKGELAAWRDEYRRDHGD